MAEVDINLITRLLRDVQAEMRTIRDENRLIRTELANKASRDELLNILRALSDRVAGFESRTETLIATFESRTDVRFDRIDARFDRIETMLRRTE